MGEHRDLHEAPASLPLLLKAALPAVPGVSALPGFRRSGSTLPDLVLSRRDASIDRAHVDAYARVCGFPRKDALPSTYLHVLAFPLHLTVMTDRSFPFPAMGMVHLENTVTRHRATTAAERYDVSVSAADLRPHAKGRVFDLLTEVSVDGEVVWEEISTYLRRGGGASGAGGAGGASRAAGAMEAGGGLSVVEGAGVEWRLEGDLGRRYAAVSGDRNPIHLYALTAKALGFPRQIAHGMWSKARCVAAVENRLPEAVRVEVAFKTPVPLPTTVRFATTPTAGATPGATSGSAFSLVDSHTDAPHLLGRTR